MFEGMVEREAARKVFRDKCTEVCNSHGYPAKDIETKQVEHIGIAFMLMDKLDELLKKNV